MEMRALTAEDIPAAKQLWMEAFGDSEAFVHFYFKNKFALKNSLGAFDKGRLIGDLTMQDMTVRIRGSLLKTGFLAGCATKEEYRKRGVMRDLLHVQLARMNENGYALCHLHPFLHAFYRKFGWETVSFVREAVIRPPAPAVFSSENVFDLDDLWRLYRAFMERADGCFERTRREMNLRIDEHLNDGGKLIAGESGYALYFVYEQEVEVIELVWMGVSPGELLAPLSAYKRPVRFFVPDYDESETSGEVLEYTMMRVVNAKKLLENLNLPGAFFRMHVHDDFCSWNNITAEADYRESRARIREQAIAQAGTDIGIRDLARLAAGKTDGFPENMKEIFTCQKTCFFNTY